MSHWEILAAVIVVLFLVARFAPRLWRIISRMFAAAVFIAASFVALAGMAVLMNNETIFEQPGVAARVRRFLTVNSAATSKEGLGSATCAFDKTAPKQAQPSSSQAKTAAVQTSAAAEAPKTAGGAQTAGTQPLQEDEDYYPELATRGYPGIPRTKLFQMALATVKGLTEWRVVNADPRSGSIDCVYTTRIFGFEDDVRIRVTPKDEIELCSQSKIGEPDSTSPLGFFPGDFGANIGHIKEFYAALQPQVDAYYNLMQEREQRN